MNYDSQFSSEDSEVLFQQIELIRPFFLDSALFLLEEMPQQKGTRLVLKVKEQTEDRSIDRLFVVDASGSTLFETMKVACDVIKKMALKKKTYHREMVVIH